jgi:acyl dehydratase
MIDPGTVLGPTAWREVTQADIDTFASLSGDRQWIHTDVERAARESPYGTTVAHGNLTLAMIDGWRDELVSVTEGGRMGVNLGYERVRFPAPVPAGSRLRATVELLEEIDQGNGWVRYVQRFTIEREGSEKPVCVADSVVQVLREPV